MRNQTVVKNYKRTIDNVTTADFEIFGQAAQNANYFTDFYCRSPQSGTFYKRVDEARDEKKEKAWLVLYEQWIAQKSPEPLFVFQEVDYTVIRDEENYPIFWIKHGWLWQPWQLAAFHDPRPEQTIIGGFGSGKTSYIAMSLITLAATIPNFRGYSVAPQMLQAMEVYRYIIQTCSDTPFWNRWVWNSPTRPFPKIVIKNSYVGESTIELLSIADNPEKVRTLEADVIFLDQAEKLLELDDVIRDLGTRLRGSVNGRPRLGKLSLIANAGDNPQLWYRYDLGERQPKTYYSINPKSTDNKHLSNLDIDRLKRSVGGSSQLIDQWMNGERPMGAGKHFSQSTVSACIDRGLNEIMATMLERKNDKTKPTDTWAMGFDVQETERAGVFKWEMPPDNTREYCVIADPGSYNPPDRNSACILVWDITNFPKSPATMQAFHWVHGNKSYEPFLFEFDRYVKMYRAQGRCAFDSTGVQKGFDELVFTTQGLAAEGMNMSQSGKFLAINALKLLMAKGMVKFPYISHMVNQLTNYDLPDTAIPQDIVMAMCMSAAYIRRFYFEEADQLENVVQQVTHDRYTRGSGNRYKRTAR